jgi:hypothetical protein
LESGSSNRNADGLAHDGATDRDPLALTARQLAGPAVEVIGEIEHLRRIAESRRSISALSSFAMRSGKAMFLRTDICG